MKPQQLASRHVVLLGIGHTNAHVVRMWKMKPVPDTDLTCISDNAVATYSGMLPAALCGQIRQEQMEIDLVRLCSSVGARLVVGRATGLDLKRREVRMADRPAIPFDVLSIGIGSVPTVEGVTVEGDSLLKIKPMQTFFARLNAAVERVVAEQGETSEPLRVVVVGGGVAGVEITFCLPPFLQQHTGRPLTLKMITRGDEIVTGVSDGLRRRVLEEMRRREIELLAGSEVERVTPGEVGLADGSTVGADLVIWATGAVPPPALKSFGLPLDPRGFLATDRSLRTVSGDPVFAVGDTGGIVQQPLPKSGVYAVRQGPVLWRNIRRLLEDKPLEDYKPQTSFMKLLNLGDGRALGEWQGISFGGRWALRLKHRIDNKFMDKFEPRPMKMDADEPMQCRGCGCKLGGDVLESALGALSPDNAPRDDAAAIGNGQPLLASTDFFSSPFDDAYLAGRVAALHSASDLVASGALVQQALANVVLLEGDGRAQQKSLSDFMAGAGLEFEAMGGSIVGGHTIVGPRMEAGFTVVGAPLGERIRNENLKVGDQLFLTKPLGIGVLLAAHMRSECRARDYAALLEVMLARQHAYAEIAARREITAGTDVTGFGLAGHLIEMLEASDLEAWIHLDQLPLLDGVEACMESQVESSLAPANRHVLPQISIGVAHSKSVPRFQVLFDPQTCGGLLLGVPQHLTDVFLQDAAEAGLAPPVRIGEVRPRESEKRLHVVR